MKKNLWTKMISLALALVCMLSLAACGGGGGVAGSYKLDSVTAAGETVTWSDFAEAAGISADDVAIGLEIREDGTFKLDMDAMDPTLSGEGTWTQDGSTITLNGTGDSLTATHKGSEITIEEEGVSLIFKK